MNHKMIDEHSEEHPTEKTKLPLVRQSGGAEQERCVQLSNRIFTFFNRSSSIGTNLRFRGIQNAFGYAFVDVTCEEASVHNTFALEHILKIGGTIYGVLTLLPSQTEGDFIPPIYLVEYKTGGQFNTISDHEFQSLKQHVIGLLDQSERQTYECVKRNLLPACQE